MLKGVAGDGLYGFKVMHHSRVTHSVCAYGLRCESLSLLLLTPLLPLMQLPCAGVGLLSLQNHRPKQTLPSIGHLGHAYCSSRKITHPASLQCSDAGAVCVSLCLAHGVENLHSGLSSKRSAHWAISPAPVCFFHSTLLEVQSDPAFPLSPSRIRAEGPHPCVSPGVSEPLCKPLSMSGVQTKAVFQGQAF